MNQGEIEAFFSGKQSRGRGMRYRAHAVDAYGVSLTDYEFECANDEAAISRANGYLQVHPIIEVWQGVRRVDRLTRGRSATEFGYMVSPGD